MIYTLPNRANLRNRATRWASPFIVSMTFCALAANQIYLFGLTQRLEAKADLTDQQHLTDRVMTLEADIARAPDSQSGVSYSDLNLVNDSFNDRLTELANVMTGVATQTDLATLLQRVQQLESNQNQPSAQTVVAPPKHKPRKLKKPQVLPFQILGQELRGGEHFLSVGPLESQSLEQCQLIRRGETYAGWRFEAIHEQSAVFTANGQTLRLTIR